MNSPRIVFLFLLLFSMVGCKETFERTDCENLSDKVQVWLDIVPGDRATFETSSGEEIALEVESASYVSALFKTTHELCEGCFDSYEFMANFSEGSNLSVQFDELEDSYSLIVMFNYDSVDYGAPLFYADSFVVAERTFYNVYYYQAAVPSLEVQSFVYDKEFGVSFIQFKSGEYWERVSIDKTPDRFIEHKKVENCFESEAKSL